MQAPIYVIFEPAIGYLKVYHLNSPAQYKKQQPDANNRYWIPGLGLFLGIWQGTKAERTGYWLRWNESREMLLWGVEMVEKERQRVDRLSAQLRAASIEPEA